MEPSTNTLADQRVALSGRRRYFWMAVAVGLLTLALARPLWQWAALALRVDLHSHVLLIPLVSAYLAWQRRASLPVPTGGGWVGLGVFGVVGAVLAWTGFGAGSEVPEPDRLAMFVGAYGCGVIAAGFAILGAPTLRALTFPCTFLLFMVPMPSSVENLCEQWLQRASADATHLLFAITGQTFLRDGQFFMLPGLNIEVAQECSGIRSSYVLFILSLVAANQLLTSPWRRALFVLSVLPISILRNGFRVFVLATLTVHVNPGIIDSPLHHRGGPIFFLLSLIPFFGLLWYLKRGELGKAGPKAGVRPQDAGAGHR